MYQTMCIKCGTIHTNGLEPDDMSYAICETCRAKGEKQVEKKTCSTCGCESSKYEMIHSAIICNTCELAMMLVDKKLLLSDGTNFWVICDQCHTPGPFRPTPKEAVLVALLEFNIDDSVICRHCSTNAMLEADENINQ